MLTSSFETRRTPLLRMRSAIPSLEMRSVHAEAIIRFG